MNWNILGFEKQKKYFESLLKHDSLSHAYLFTGPEMSGKMMFAKELYGHLNGREAVLGDPDLRTISSPNESIGIEDIREAKNFLSLSPFYGPYKCLLVDNAEKMTGESSNALLKVLEEPSRHSLLILISSQPGKLLSTITSRCQEIRFQPDSITVRSIINAKGLTKEDADLVMSLSQGKVGHALVILEKGKLAETKGKIREFSLILNQGIVERLQYVKKIYEKEEYPELIPVWLAWAYGQGKRDKNLLQGLLGLSSVIAQPQYSHRLALESFFVNLPCS